MRSKFWALALAMLVPSTASHAVPMPKSTVSDCTVCMLRIADEASRWRESRDEQRKLDARRKLWRERARAANRQREQAAAERERREAQRIADEQAALERELTALRAREAEEARRKKQDAQVAKWAQIEQQRLEARRRKQAQLAKWRQAEQQRLADLRRQRREARLARWAEVERARMAKIERERERQAQLAKWQRIERQRMADLRRKRRQARLARWAEIERRRIAKLERQREQRAQLARWQAIEQKRLAKARKEAKLREWARIERLRLAGGGCVNRINQVIEENPITFALGSSTLEGRSFQTLREIARLANECPEVELEIAGHTDNIGPANANKIMSQERADSVRSYLRRRGVDRRRMKAVGYGMERPRFDNNTVEGRAANRRIEFGVSGL